MLEAIYALNVLLYDKKCNFSFDLDLVVFPNWPFMFDSSSPRNSYIFSRNLWIQRWIRSLYFEVLNLLVSDAIIDLVFTFLPV